MTKVELTDLRGNKFWVFPSWIEIVRDPYPREYEGECGAVLEFSSKRFAAVRESKEEVMYRLEFA